MNPLLIAMMIITTVAFGLFLFIALSEPKAPPQVEPTFVQEVPCMWCDATGVLTMYYSDMPKQEKTCLYCNGTGIAAENDTYSHLCYTDTATTR